MRDFDADDRQAHEEELVREGYHFGRRRHRRSSPGTMEAMCYDAAMPVSPRDPATEWRSIDEGGWTPAPAAFDPVLAEILRTFPGGTAAAVVAGMTLYVTLARYGGAGPRKSA